MGSVRLSVGVKLALLVVCLVSVTFAGFVWLSSRSAIASMEATSVAALQRETRLAVDMTATFDEAARRGAGRLAGSLAAQYPGEIAVSADAKERAGAATVPVLTSGGVAVSGQVEIVERFAVATGATVEVFVRSGSALVPIVASERGARGESALGPTLPAGGRVFDELAAGRSVASHARKEGREWTEAYEPLLDAKGGLAGALKIGLDCTDGVAALRERLRALKVGQTGYLFVLDASEGAERGTLLLHPAKEGQNILGAKDADGRAFIAEMLSRGAGTIRYPWVNKEIGETAAKEKLVAFERYEPWGWVIAAGTQTEELTREARDNRARMTALCAAVLAALSAATVLAIRRMVSRPLGVAVAAARRIAAGDLTGRIAVTSRDETGELMGALADMNGALARMAAEMREAAGAVSDSAQAIAESSSEITGRTEAQAESLDEAAKAMQSLSEMVHRSAAEAVTASSLSSDASRIAEDGGGAVKRLIGTMEAIRASSEKISGIIEIIDGIAFQTNILALNASVEAARAGDEGRGFSVVASQVQDLAARSKAAAREIGGLIGESTERVREGAATAGSAGARMAEAERAARRVTELIGQLSAAFRSQTAALDGAERTVVSIDGAARENAGVVAGVAATAAALRERASRLNDAVSALRV